jgi:hypothetical protein
MRSQAVSTAEIFSRRDMGWAVRSGFVATIRDARFCSTAP